MTNGNNKKSYNGTAKFVTSVRAVVGAVTFPRDRNALLGILAGELISAVALSKDISVK